MKVVCDIETDKLVNPSKIWVIVCKETITGNTHIFRRVTDDQEERSRFLAYASRVSHWIGHNWLEFDWPVLRRLVQLDVPDIAVHSTDTLIISKLVNFSAGAQAITPTKQAQADQSGVAGRTVATVHSGETGLLQQSDTESMAGVVARIKHSIEAYGIEFGYPKLDNKGPSFFREWSQELEDYCIRDVEICHRIYLKYQRIIDDPSWQPSISLEHRFQLIVNDLHSNGFSFNVHRATSLLDRVTKELEVLDKDILETFPPREVLIREFTPKLTKFGTISRTSVPRLLWANIHQYTAGQPYRHTRLEEFNPASHKQVIEVLNESGWKPTDKTATHVETERQINRLKYTSHKSDQDNGVLEKLRERLQSLQISGWKVNEANLTTLPPTAPAPARLLAKRILLESRRRTLTEWLGLVEDDGRIRGRFQGIGTWTHRMSHQNPNTANIPNDTDISGKKKLLGKEMRALWQAPKGRLLVGVDAEGIQLRIFAHYIDDPEFTKALVEGKKNDKTDPHSLNQRILGRVCRSRAAAKRFIYALLLGAGMQRLSQILECSETECKEALDRLLRRYEGWRRLKSEQIPRDAANGYFIGLDGRKVQIPGDTKSEKSHLCMSGYLQNGEAVVMKLATLIWYPEVCGEKKFPEDPGRTAVNGLPLSQRFNELFAHNTGTLVQRNGALLVNFVHDEWQVETKNDMEQAIWVAKTISQSLAVAGEQLDLRCPLAGSYYNDDLKDYTIGTNWASTH